MGGKGGGGGGMVIPIYDARDLLVEALSLEVLAINFGAFHLSSFSSAVSSFFYSFILFRVSRSLSLIFRVVEQSRVGCRPAREGALGRGEGEGAGGPFVRRLLKMIFGRKLDFLIRFCILLEREK